MWDECIERRQAKTAHCFITVVSRSPHERYKDRHIKTSEGLRFGDYLCIFRGLGLEGGGTSSVSY